VRRREVGISIAAGLVLVLLVVSGSGVGMFVLRYVGTPAFNFWYVGAAAIVLALVLRASHVQPGLVRILGLVGIAWIVFVAGAIGVLFIMLATSAPFGP
jgi:hypothetical protein